MRKAQALLGTMLNIKPLMILEEGSIIPLEKVRSRAGVVDKLFEFVAEFPHIEEIAILQVKKTEEAYALIERIHTVSPDLSISIVPYSPSIACHIGPDAIGLYIYEGS